MTQKHLVLLVSSVTALLLLPNSVGAEKRPPSYCPSPGTIVPLTKAMNLSFMKDFKGCDIVVEATFLRMGTPQSFRLGGYDTKKNTPFQVIEKGGVPQSAFGQSFGTFAGTPKVNADILFQLKQGDVLLLRGAPVGYKSARVAVFHATSVVRKP